jgi:hypothetical protein
MNNELLTAETARVWPEKIVVPWRRFSSGLWRVPKGDIDDAYSGDIFPKIKVFTHEGGVFTNCGMHFGGAAGAGADCYLLIPAAEYRGPEPRQYTYEGRETAFRGKKFKLGQKAEFVATDPTVDEWRRMWRVLYVEGGWFARQASYGLFLREDRRATRTGNERAALRLELAGGLLELSKAQMKEHLDGKAAARPAVPLTPKGQQLDLLL